MTAQLNWLPKIHLHAGAYEAWVAPHAGGRLSRLLWRGPEGDRELVVPVHGGSTFEPDTWPKAGAFPMLPYTNRLAGARFPWRGKEYKVRPVPGQAHGLHGLGHRQIWQIKSIGTRRVCLYLQHQADELEWPWSFSAQLEYEVSESGLQVRLSIRNDSSVAAPAILGWHPYIPAYWLASNDIRSLCSSVHDLGSDGLNYPNPACARPGLQQISVNLQVPGTLAMENWSSSWELRSGAGERWRLESDAAHLVHHVPADRSYACAEPITALPGSLRGHSIHGVEAAIALEPGHRRQLNCGLLAKVSSEERG